MSGRGGGTGTGRGKGTPNKRSTEFRQRVDELCEKYGYDLIESLVLTAQGTDEVCSTIPAATEFNETQRDQALESRAQHAMTARRLLVEYAYPKLKAIEYDPGTDGAAPVFTFQVVKSDRREKAA